MISFKVSSIAEFREAYQTVFRTTQVVDLLRRDFCCMEATEGKVYFYRSDGAVYTEAWCDAHVIESGKIVVSAAGFDSLAFCEGPMAVKKSKKGVIVSHSRGDPELREVSEDPDVFRRKSPVGSFVKVPINPKSIVWTDGEYLKLGGKFMECNVQTIKVGYFVNEIELWDKIVYFPTDKKSLLREDSMILCEEGMIWVKNGNALHQVSGRMGVLQDEEKSFLAPILLSLPVKASVILKSKELRDAMAYAKSLTILPERHDGLCSIRYTGDNVLHIENMFSERAQQESSYILTNNLEPGAGEFDLSVVPGQIVTCLDAMGAETVTLDSIGTAIRLTGDNGVVGAMAVVTDHWRKLNGQ